MTKIKEYQMLVGLLAVALSLLTSACMVFYRAGEMKAQHEQILNAQGQMLRVLTEKCR